MVGVETPTFWPGLCECGCGEVTRIARMSSTAKGWTKGEPLRFRMGHSRRVQTMTPETGAKISAALKGRPKSPRHTALVSAAKAGVPVPLLRGDNTRSWKGSKASAVAIHKWLSLRHPKTGTCEECGTDETRTHYAFKRHPEPYTRIREDYRELCPSCHKKYDSSKHLREEILRLKEEIARLGGGSN